jgi:hypothetical protein
MCRVNNERQNMKALQISNELNQLKNIVRQAVGNSRTSYATRENIERLAASYGTWIKSVEDDPLANQWFEHLKRGGKDDVDLEGLKNAKVKFAEFEELELAFVPWKIQLQNIPDFLKTPIYKTLVDDDGKPVLKDKKEQKVIDRWEDNPVATDTLIDTLRRIGALEG